MDANMKQKLREFLKETLEKHGDYKDFVDNDSLFVSGRLDSFPMIKLVM